jgi:hypothetical protein
MNTISGILDGIEIQEKKKSMRLKGERRLQNIHYLC